MDKRVSIHHKTKTLKTFLELEIFLHLQRVAVDLPGQKFFCLDKLPRKSAILTLYLHPPDNLYHIYIVWERPR